MRLSSALFDHATARLPATIDQQDLPRIDVQLD
jgi:hypothetical protein